MREARLGIQHSEGRESDNYELSALGPKRSRREVEKCPGIACRCEHWEAKLPVSKERTHVGLP